MNKVFKNFFCKADCNEVPPLTESEVSGYLATENHQVINSLYSLVLSLYNNESDRAKSLDTKAAALFGFVGAFISAIFIVLGFLGNPNNAKLAGTLTGTSLYLIVTVLVLLGCALMSLFLAVVVKKGWKAPGDRDLFEAVHKYDGHGLGPGDNHSQPDHDYKRHLIEHFWKLYKACFDQNEAKAMALFYGQSLVFLGLLLLIAVQIRAVLAFQSNMNSSKDQITTSVTTVPAPAPQGKTERSLPNPDSSKNTAGTRPPPLDASSSGRTVRNSQDSASPLRPSGDGNAARNSKGSK